MFATSHQVVGRFAAKIVTILQGKHKPTYLPNADRGDSVVVLNAQHLKFTGNKWQQKVYKKHSGFVGGLKEVPAHRWRERAPERVCKETKPWWREIETFPVECLFLLGASLPSLPLLSCLFFSCVLLCVPWTVSISLMLYVCLYLFMNGFYFANSLIYALRRCYYTLCEACCQRTCTDWIEFRDLKSFPGRCTPTKHSSLTSRRYNRWKNLPRMIWRHWSLSPVWPTRGISPRASPNGERNKFGAHLIRPRNRNNLCNFIATSLCVFHSRPVHWMFN